MDSAVVAFSGGVDSTLLLKVARSAISGKVIAVTSASATIASEDLAFAKQMASFIGVEHYLVETEEIQDSRFTSNPPNRCYYCKSGLFDKLSAFAKAQGILFILDGSNADDLGDFRPGRKAALEAGVRSPLLEAGLGKAEIRAISKELGLPAWDRPASPCLASRFPYGHQITVESLKQVEKAEGFLRTLGFEQFRVRHYGDLARIEVLLSDFSRIVKDETRQKILFFFKSCGYREIALDLEGFRSGRLNEVLEHLNF
jgi:uncharacterized protein